MLRLSEDSFDQEEYLKYNSISYERFGERVLNTGEFEISFPPTLIIKDVMDAEDVENFYKRIKEQRNKRIEEDVERFYQGEIIWKNINLEFMTSV